MTDLLDLVLTTNHYNHDYRWYGYGPETGPFEAYREFKPMRDSIEVTAIFWKDGHKQRVDVEFYLEGHKGLDGDEFWRYVNYVIQKEVRAGNYYNRLALG